MSYLNSPFYVNIEIGDVKKFIKIHEILSLNEMKMMM